VLAGYVDAIMARVFEHAHVVELAEWSSIPVINGLSDFSHPCQALADALTIWEEFGGLRGLKISYVGDGNKVSISLMQIAAALGAHFTIAHPEGYGMPDDAVASAVSTAEANGGQVEIVRSARIAAADAFSSSLVA
jgi:ornithine carbamoyltransferase